MKKIMMKFSGWLGSSKSLFNLKEHHKSYIEKISISLNRYITFWEDIGICNITFVLIIL